MKYLRRLLRFLIFGIPNKKIETKIAYISPSKKLDGKKVLVTGGNKGIGLAIAKKFSQEGANVVVTGRSDYDLNQVHPHISYLRYDVTDICKMKDLFDKAGELLGGEVDVLVNNAGISLHEDDILSVSEESYDRQLSTNLKGAYFMSKNFIQRCMQKNLKSANILFVTSERGTFVDDLPYGLTKAALNSLVQGLAYRFVDKGIRVNAVAPGITATELVGFSEKDNLYHDNQMNNRIYLPAEIGEVACFLVSDASNCMTGQIIVCNEGKSINSYYSKLNNTL